MRRDNDCGITLSKLHMRALALSFNLFKTNPFKEFSHVFSADRHRLLPFILLIIPSMVGIVKSLFRKEGANAMNSILTVLEEGNNSDRYDHCPRLSVRFFPFSETTPKMEVSSGRIPIFWVAA